MESNIFGLNKKWSLVVGGGQGIGEACCLALAEAGCNVVVLDIDQERAVTVASEVASRGAKAEALAGDILDEKTADAVMMQAQHISGGLDALVTVVGSSRYAPIIDTPMARWDIEQNFNVRYVFQAATAFARACIADKRPGAATFVSSVSGITSAPLHAPYGAAKAALMHLVKSMAVEWAEHGIRVNSVAPGPIVTPRLPDSKEWNERIRQSNLPMQRRGMPKEIANAVLFLCSDMASYITGQSLAVDGGLTAANIMALPRTITKQA